MVDLEEKVRQDMVKSVPKKPVITRPGSFGMGGRSSDHDEIE